MFYRLAPQLVLCSSWRPYWPRPQEKVLRLRHNVAFPPSHPTTRLCLEMLAKILPFPAVAQVLDVGCGSGILALAAAAQGAKRCLAVDLSLTAARLTRDNVRTCGLADVVTAARGSTECLRGPFQVILANLPAAVQLAKVAELCRLADPAEGVMILSGFRDTQEEDLRLAYDAAGWRVQRRTTRDEWAIEMPPERSFTWAAWLLRPSGDKIVTPSLL